MEWNGWNEVNGFVLYLEFKFVLCLCIWNFDYYIFLYCIWNFNYYMCLCCNCDAICFICIRPQIVSHLYLSVLYVVFVQCSTTYTQIIFNVLHIVNFKEIY